MAMILGIPPHIIGQYISRLLLVSLNIGAILHESTVYQRRERLSKMTDGSGSGGVYGATIAQINAPDGDKLRLGMAALTWISHAERPLRADELGHALAVEPCSTDFNIGNTLRCRHWLAAVKGLLP